MIKPSKKRSVKSIDPGKENCQKWHFIKRIRERLGIRLTDNDYDHIISAIKNKKECNFCEIKYIGMQSNRLAIYEFKFGKDIFNALYDKARQSLVTVLFQIEGITITKYYDVFNNNVNIKHDLGYNCGWVLNGDMLEIPSETVVKKDDYWEVVSDGLLNGKKFKYDESNLYEVM